MKREWRKNGIDENRLRTWLQVRRLQYCPSRRAVSHLGLGCERSKWRCERNDVFKTVDTVNGTMTVLAILVNLWRIILWLWVWYQFTISNESIQKVRKSLKLSYNSILFNFKEICKLYSKTCVVHFVVIGKISNKDGAIARLFNHLFDFVDKKPGGTTVISH